MYDMVGNFIDRGNLVAIERMVTEVFVWRERSLSIKLDSGFEAGFRLTNSDGDEKRAVSQEFEDGEEEKIGSEFWI